MCYATVVKILKWNGGHGTAPAVSTFVGIENAPSIHAGLPTPTLSMPPTVNTALLLEPMRMVDFMTSTFLWMTTLWHKSMTLPTAWMPYRVFESFEDNAT